MWAKRLSESGRLPSWRILVLEDPFAPFLALTTPVEHDIQFQSSFLFYLTSRVCFLFFMAHYSFPFPS